MWCFIFLAGFCWSSITFATPLFPYLGAGDPDSSLALVIFSRLLQGILQGIFIINYLYRLWASWVNITQCILVVYDLSCQVNDLYFQSSTRNALPVCDERCRAACVRQGENLCIQLHLIWYSWRKCIYWTVWFYYTKI